MTRSLFLPPPSSSFFIVLQNWWLSGKQNHVFSFYLGNSHVSSFPDVSSEIRFPSNKPRWNFQLWKLQKVITHMPYIYKKTLYSLTWVQLTVDWLQAGLLNEHTAAVGERGLVVGMRRRLVNRTRLCLKIHRGSRKMPQAYFYKVWTLHAVVICYYFVHMIFYYWNGTEVAQSV